MLMGLGYEEGRNYIGADGTDKGRIVFDGVNNQRFPIEATWKDDKIYAELGKALIQMGERKKCMEIAKVISIT